MAETRGKVLLIVENHPPLRGLLYDWLARTFDGCRCVVAGSGEEALHLMAAERPRVVVLDIGLPDGGGIEVLKRIKSAAPATPVVMLSNYDGEAYLSEALREGARAYIQKFRMYTDLLPVLTELLEEPGTEAEPLARRARTRKS